MNPKELFGEPGPQIHVKPHYTLIILIIASPGDHYDDFKRVWEGYMNRFPTVKSFFLYSDEKLGSPIVQTESSIIHKFKEWYEPGILYKTIAGMKWCEENYTYDYVLRTNLSSFFVIPRLLSFLELQPKTGFAAAKQNVFREGVGFLSGAGFILSKDVIEKLLTTVFENPATIAVDYPDDVALSQIVEKMEDINMLDIPRYDCDCEVLAENIDESVFHIRNKTEWKYGNRELDKKNMVALYTYFYSMC